MVVKTMMRLSSPSPEKMRMRKKFKVSVRVDAIEGLPSSLPGAGAAAAVEIEWRRRPSPMVAGALSFLVGRKKPERGVTSKRIVEEGFNVATARWGDGDQENRFEKVCRFRDSDLAAGPIDGFDSARAWDVSFSVLYGNSDDGVEAKELERIGTATVNLVEWARESLSRKTGARAEEKELKKHLPISLETDRLSSYGMLYVTVSFTEVSPANVKPSSSGNAENTNIEQMGQQIERPNSESSARGSTEDDDILAGNSNRCHPTSSSGISSPESESTSKRWFSWRKKSKSSFSYMDLEGESKRTSLSQELLFSDNINKGSWGRSSHQDDIDSIGRWTSEELMSRDKQAKLKVQTFFASIDQRDPTAGGESACTAIVAVIADALHRNELNTPTRSEFDALIREGSLEWQKLCNNKSYIERFPDKHFDLETILEAKTRPISILHDKSFIGFFQPESFKSLHGLMSFDDVWAEIVSDDGRDSKVYIISWNDHFFILKLEADAYYIMDTLGERLHEGCQKAYVLKFDDTTEMYHRREENKGAEDNEELICRGKNCCREYINRFLAAIPLQEELELEKKGIETNTALHQRLQIEFHLTRASTDGGSDGHLNCNDCWTSTLMNPWTAQGETILLGI